MFGVHIVVFYFNESYPCFYIRINLLELIRLLYIVYQNFVGCFQNHRKGVHYPPWIFVLRCLDNISIYYFTDLFYKLIPTACHGLQDGIDSLQIVDFCSFCFDVDLLLLFIHFQKCRIIYHISSIHFYRLNIICKFFVVIGVCQVSLRVIVQFALCVHIWFVRLTLILLLRCNLFQII